MQKLNANFSFFRIFSVMWTFMKNFIYQNSTKTVKKTPLLTIQIYQTTKHNTNKQKISSAPHPHPLRSGSSPLRPSRYYSSDLLFSVLYSEKFP